MIDMSYDPEADAVYITWGAVTSTVPKRPVRSSTMSIPDGRIVGIEILSASKVLVPGDWKKAHAPGVASVSAAG